jgi:PAS domain-containing protein
MPLTSILNAAVTAKMPPVALVRQEGGLLDRLLEQTTDVALVMDGSGRILEVKVRDPAFATLAKKSWVGCLWHDIVTVESKDKVDALLEAARQGQPHPPRQVNHPARSGPDWPVLYSAMALSDPEALADLPKAKRTLPRPHAAQNPIHDNMLIVAFGRDLRDNMALQRQLVEAQQAMERDYWKLRETETLYRSLFQASSEGVVVVEGSKLRVQELNPAARTMLLAGDKEAKGKKLVGSAIDGWFVDAAAQPLATAAERARSSGQAQRLRAELAAGGEVDLALDHVQQDGQSLLMLRMVAANIQSLEGVALSARRKGRLAANSEGMDTSVMSQGVAANDAALDAAIGASFVRTASDAFAFTDTQGRVVRANRAFARLVQLPDESQAVGKLLEQWVGRSGVELQVLLTNLRGGSALGLFATQMRGERGAATPVEIAAMPLDLPAVASYAFAIRDTGRRLATQSASTPMRAPPTSAAQLSELVGRVPLKQIVTETSDLIERLSIESALEMARDNRALAAQMLGLSRQSLYVKMHRYGLGGMGESDSQD